MLKAKLKKYVLYLLVLAIVSTGILSGCQTAVQETAGESSSETTESTENTDTYENAETSKAAAIEKYSKNSYILSTVITITYYDASQESIIDDCFKLIQDYEQLLSRTIATSEIAVLNSEGTVEASDDTVELIKAGLNYSEISDGAFDIAIEPLSSLWDFLAETPAAPDKDLIKEAVQHVEYTNVEIDGNTVTLKDPEGGIDLGAIAKGYIADKCKEFLLEQGVTSAIINLGGNMLLVGEKPTEDGPADFAVGIQYPFDNQGNSIAVIRGSDFSVVTSGTYERCFTEDGQFYHHILDPDTGYPYDNGLVSVTIISEKSVDGDGLSTTCFALGLEKGMELVESLENVEAVFITGDDYELHVSSGIGTDISFESLK